MQNLLLTIAIVQLCFLIYFIGRIHAMLNEWIGKDVGE